MNPHHARAVRALRLVCPAIADREMAGHVLPAFMQLDQFGRWDESAGGRMTITEAMQWMRDRFGISYAPNTRESVRFSVVNPLVAAGVLVPNPDDPSRRPTSPKYCYAIPEETLELIRLIQ